MIFRPEMVEAILAGDKTETRRPVRNPGRRCRYRPGHDYAVQPGRGQHAVARMLIQHVWQQRLGEITPEQAWCEGFSSRPAFFAYWRELYGHVDLDQRVWVIRFALLREAA